MIIIIIIIIIITSTIIMIIEITAKYKTRVFFAKALSIKR